MINFYAVDFSERRSEEVIRDFLTLSVYLTFVFWTLLLSGSHQAYTRVKVHP